MEKVVAFTAEARYAGVPGTIMEIEQIPGDTGVISSFPMAFIRPEQTELGVAVTTGGFAELLELTEEVDIKVVPMLMMVFEAGSVAVRTWGSFFGM
jgi:hypothetical protein